MRVIGIDPDLSASGLAVWEGGELVALQNLSLLQLLPWLQDQCDQGAHFVLEDVESNKPVFKRPGTNARTMQKIAQNVGQVKALARQIQQALEQIGASYTMTRPLKGWFKKAKKDRQLFNQLTGWQHRSNADQRDAAMLALQYIRAHQHKGSA